MSNTNFQKQPNQDKESVGRTDRHSLVPLEDASQEELALLKRVEADTLHRHEQLQQEQQKTSSNFWNQPWRRFAIVGVTGMVALFLFVGWSFWSHSTVALPSLKTEGTFIFTSTKHKASQQQLVQTTLHRSAKIHDPQGWTLRSQTRSQIQIVRPAPRVTEVKLKQGAIAVHVVPGFMKRFVVKCNNGLRVIVKGTTFLVWQKRASVRVEVTRGHVMVKRGKRVLLHLYKGQGARLTDEQKDMFQMYRIPPKTDSWYEKVEIFAKKNPEQLFPYAWEVGSTTSLSHKLRMQVMEASAHALQGAKRWSQSSRLWSRIYAMNPKGYGAQTALYQAAHSCRLSGQKRSHCVTLYQTYLKRFPQGLSTLRKASEYWSSTLRTKDTNEK